MKRYIWGNFLVVLILLCIGCAGSTTVDTTTPTTTNAPTTTSPANGSPSVEELRAGNFSHPEIPRITPKQLKLMIDEGLEPPDGYFPVVTEVAGEEVSQRLSGTEKFISFQISSGAPVLSDDILFVLRNLPKDKLLIFYDYDGKDTLAATAAQALLDLNEGHNPQNIKVLWKGFNNWKELGYPYCDVINGSYV